MIVLTNVCRLCNMPTNNLIWCDELCRSLQIYDVFTKESWRKSKKPDPAKWALWVSHRYNTHIDDVEPFTW